MAYNEESSQGEETDEDNFDLSVPSTPIGNDEDADELTDEDPTWGGAAPDKKIVAKKKKESRKRFRNAKVNELQGWHLAFFFLFSFKMFLLPWFPVEVEAFRNKKLNVQDDGRLKVDKLLAWRLAPGAGSSSSSGSLIVKDLYPRETEPSPLPDARMDHFTGKEFLVTFGETSYLHVKWVDATRIRQSLPQVRTKVLRFINANPYPHDMSTEIFPPNYCEADKVLAQRLKGEKIQYFVKWMGLNYGQSTWEDAANVDDFKVREFVRFNRVPHNVEDKPFPDASEWRKLKSSPKFKNGNELRAWQIEGVSWLLYNWYSRRGCIMADEMGLGKTVQTVATLLHVSNAYSRFEFCVFSIYSCSILFC